MAHPQVTEAGAGVTAGAEVEGARASAPEEQSATDELDKHRTEALSRKYTANARRERLLPWQRGLGAGTADALAVNKCIDYELHRDAVPAEAPAAMGTLAPSLPPTAWAPLTFKDSLRLNARQAQDSCPCPPGLSVSPAWSLLCLEKRQRPQRSSKFLPPTEPASGLASPEPTIWKTIPQLGAAGRDRVFLPSLSFHLICARAQTMADCATGVNPSTPRLGVQKKTQHPSLL